MGQIIIELSGNTNRRFKLKSKELEKAILAMLDSTATAVHTQNPALTETLTAEDKADIRDARRVMKKGDFMTLDELETALEL